MLVNFGEKIENFRKNRKTDTPFHKNFRKNSKRDTLFYFRPNRKNVSQKVLHLFTKFSKKIGLFIGAPLKIAHF